MKGLQPLEPFDFLLCGIRFSDAGIIVYKCEEVPLSSKVYGRYRVHMFYVNKLIRLCYPWLKYLMIPPCGCYFFVAIVYITFSIINKDNIIMGKVLF